MSSSRRRAFQLIEFAGDNSSAAPMPRSNVPIYLNHAGTSWPKPPAVIRAASAVWESEPNRWADIFEESHETIARFYDAPTDRLLPTPSCTAALSLAIADQPWMDGDRVLTSQFEHHAMQRSLTKLADRGVQVTPLPESTGALIDLDAMREQLARGRVRLVAFTAACNVTGLMAPLREAIALAHEFGALVLVDGAQVAGWQDLRLTELEVDLFTIAAHKGPQAPWGVGALYVAKHVPMTCPLATCAVPRPDANEAPSIAAPQQIANPMPGYCDAGSVNLSALAGWAAACDWLQRASLAGRLERARRVAKRFADGLRAISGATLYHAGDIHRRMPTIATTFASATPTEVSRHLGEHGIVVSAGFQCAPHAHDALGTQASGVVRFSFGPQSSEEEADLALAALAAFGD